MGLSGPRGRQSGGHHSRRRRVCKRGGLRAAELGFPAGDGTVRAPPTPVEPMPMPTDLAATVKNLHTFVPAKDFAQSQRFYAELGFEVTPLADKLAEVRLGGHGFLLQDYFVEAW